MPVNARHYRGELYRLRAHPTSVPGDFVDQRDSFTTLYLSLIPFLLLEYYAEATWEVLPSGLVFPVGYLLFWAFYYTYYKPGFLEDRLSAPQRWEFTALPTVVVGVAIWFVKVTVVELTDLLFLRWLFARQAPTRRRGAGTSRPASHRAPGGNQAFNEGTRVHEVKYPPHPPPGLPRDVLNALGILGLGECRNWNEIHRRYRELAKQYHPDLNKDITDVGRRFMMYDAAYRKLAAVKDRYFQQGKRA
jgi:hypothetical protein